MPYNRILNDRYGRGVAIASSYETLPLDYSRNFIEEPEVLTGMFKVGGRGRNSGTFWSPEEFIKTR